MNAAIQRQAVTRAKVAAALAAGDASVKQLCQRARLSGTTISRHLHQLREAGQAHIATWLPRRGHTPVEAVWRAGPGEDAPSPQADSERTARRRRSNQHKDQPGRLPKPRKLGLWGCVW